MVKNIAYGMFWGAVLSVTCVCTWKLRALNMPYRSWLQKPKLGNDEHAKKKKAPTCNFVKLSKWTRIGVGTVFCGHASRQANCLSGARSTWHLLDLKQNRKKDKEKGLYSYIYIYIRYPKKSKEKEHKERNERNVLKALNWHESAESKLHLGLKDWNKEPGNMNIVTIVTNSFLLLVVRHLLLVASCSY